MANARWIAVGLSGVCPLLLLGCTRETPPRLAVYGLAESYVTRPDSVDGLILELHEDGTFVLSGAIHGDPGEVNQLGEVGRGTWSATATGIALSSEQWEATFLVGETPMASWRAADTLATLEWRGGTRASPVDSASFVSWPAYNELFHPRGGWGRQPSSW